MQFVNCLKVRKQSWIQPGIQTRRCVYNLYVLNKENPYLPPESLFCKLEMFLILELWFLAVATI